MRGYKHLELTGGGLRYASRQRTSCSLIEERIFCLDWKTGTRDRGYLDLVEVLTAFGPMYPPISREYLCNSFYLEDD